ncbi:MAG: hypothetical protein HOB79_01465 [Rhodospirillaceae bacterium]|nr:hypothetical protein [Rhodospirillales bacterium]MBT3906631.1 hypothetical protein [Rhodospirillaceae bacterium]MBT4699717.1 hypothetical protein [Rhodospirillaceae bacterium]MBT5033230.1 hypothetical protein [Rhodospirillaceae bacterium]MBT6218998.1 hypothetical protein [Rhodospirillaceae bacterium]
MLAVIVSKRMGIMLDNAVEQQNGEGIVAQAVAVSHAVFHGRRLV